MRAEAASTLPGTTPASSFDASTAGSTIAVSVVFSPRERVVEACEVVLPAGACVRDALVASGLSGRYPEIDLERQRMGVWGRLCELQTRLTDGDRVELYRPLHADPMEARRARHRLLVAARRRAGVVPKR